MAKKNNAKLPDYKTLLLAGINPKTGLPLKMGNVNKGIDQEAIKRMLRIIDEQDAVNRYVWSGIPTNLSSQEIERMLYYRGQLCFFYMEETDDFYFLPYALDGTIDLYGRYNTIHPIPYAGGTDNKKGDKVNTRLDTVAEELSKKILTVVRDVVNYDGLTDEEIYNNILNSCVLLHDYSKQAGEEIIPRQIVNDWIICEQATLIPYLDTNLLIGTGIKALRVNDADQKAEVTDTANAMFNAAQNRNPYIAAIGTLDWQDLGNSGNSRPDDYLLAFQSLDNIRLSTYGIENGGVYEKKAHILESENAVNNSNISNAYNDGLLIRQRFCDIVNSIYGLNIWCDASENSINADLDMNGILYDGEQEPEQAE